MWDRSLKPEHFKAGFRATGLYPFSREAIPASKLSTSLPFRSGTDTNPNSADNECEGGKETIGEVTVTAKLTCAECDRNMTPMKLHVVAYLTKHIQAKPKPRSRDNRKVKPTVYGEVLTSDEIVERLEQEEKEKTEKAAAKEREKAKKAAARAEKEKEKAQVKCKGKKAPKTTKKKTSVAETETESENDEVGKQFYCTMPHLYYAFVQMRKSVSHVKADMKMMMKLCRQDGLVVIIWIVVAGIILPVLALQESPVQPQNLSVNFAKCSNLNQLASHPISVNNPDFSRYKLT